MLGTLTIGDPDRLRHDFRSDGSAEIRRRRQIIGLSLVGMASMTAGTLLQTGLIDHLPDPPVPGMDTNRVSLSRTAYQFGAPDAAFGCASFALNLPLAAWGGRDRAAEQPWAPIMAAGKAAVDAVASAWFLYQMPTKLKTWCGYCLITGFASFGVLALTLPEARKAWRAKYA